jgi:hypothetical protein
MRVGLIDLLTPQFLAGSLQQLPNVVKEILTFLRVQGVGPVRAGGSVAISERHQRHRSFSPWRRGGTIVSVSVPEDTDTIPRDEQILFPTFESRSEANGCPDTLALMGDRRRP